jgi:hypothetical protein
MKYYLIHGKSKGISLESEVMLAIFGAMLVTKDGASNESAVSCLKN